MGLDKIFILICGGRNMTEKMKEIMGHLQECSDFFLATVEDGKPFVRPISVLCEYNDKIYFISSNHKLVYNQIKENGNVEICGLNTHGSWVRINGKVAEDESRAARIAPMDSDIDVISSVYSKEDDIMPAFYFESGTVRLCSAKGEDQLIEL